MLAWVNLRRTLEVEMKRRSAKPVQQLLSELKDVQAYQVKFAAKDYTVEVQLLENTDQYIHVSVDVDDGTLPASFRPLSDSFIREK